MQSPRALANQIRSARGATRTEVPMSSVNQGLIAEALELIDAKVNSLFPRPAPAQATVIDTEQMSKAAYL